MIVPLGTLLGRAVRRRTALPLLAANSPEVVRAALSGNQGHSMAIVVNAGLPEAPLLLATVHWLACRYTADVSIIVEGVENVSSLAAFPEVALLLPLGSGYRGAKPHIAAVPALIDPISLEGLLRDDGALAAMLPGSVTAGYVAEVRRMLRLPIFLDEEVRSTESARLLLRAGVSGLLMRQQLNDAYTAGLRAALGNQEHTDPVKYGATANLAVRERLATFSIHLA